jgi:apolipoprotein N-acyltransferase
MPSFRDGCLFGLLPIAAIFLGIIQPIAFSPYGNWISYAGLAVTFYVIWKRRSWDSPYFSGFVTGLGVSIIILGFLAA